MILLFLVKIFPIAYVIAKSSKFPGSPTISIGISGNFWQQQGMIVVSCGGNIYQMEVRRQQPFYAMAGCIETSLHSALLRCGRRAGSFFLSFHFFHLCFLFTFPFFICLPYVCICALSSRKHCKAFYKGSDRLTMASYGSTIVTTKFVQDRSSVFFILFIC